MTPILNPWQQDQTIAKSKITNRASIRVLERYPLTDGDIEKLFDAEEMAGGDPEMLYKLCRQLLNAWTYIIYFQPKPDDLIGSFREQNYPDPVIKGILEAHSSPEFARVVESLASCSFSGLPRVISTDWTSRTVVHRDNQPVASDREAVLTFSTDHGVRDVRLGGKELEKLYWTVNQVQASLDGLLER